MEDNKVTLADLPHWFYPFVPYVVNWGIEDGVIAVVLEIPFYVYNWGSIDNQGLQERGITHIEIEKMGLHFTENNSPVKEYTGGFNYWRITINFNNDRDPKNSTRSYPARQLPCKKGSC